MSELKCEIQNESGSELTVGKIFYIVCNGTDELLDAKSELRVDQESAYKLKLLGLETKNQLKLKVTSYAPGEHQIKAVQVVGEKSSVVLGDLNFSVKSVINPNEPQQEPFGPRGPIDFGLPLYYWLMIAVVLLNVAYGIFRKLTARKRKQKRIVELVEQLQGQTPYHFLRAFIRKSMRQYPFLTDASVLAKPEEVSVFLSDLEKTYRVFVGTEFEIETLHLKESQIVAELFKTMGAGDSISKLKSNTLKVFNEFVRAQKAEMGSLNAKDCAQIFELLKTNTDELYELSESKKKKVKT